MTDDDAVETFYTDDRWQNWLDRLKERISTPRMKIRLAFC